MDDSGVIIDIVDIATVVQRCRCRGKRKKGAYSYSPPDDGGRVGATEFGHRRSRARDT
jgi:hypothetical protein